MVTKNKGKIVNRIIFLTIISLFTASCAQIMAAGQPAPFRPDINNGTERAFVVGQLGHATSSEDMQNGMIKQEVYKYTDGGGKNHWASKTGRIIGYTAGDLFTLFLSQLIWMPLEYGAFSPNERFAVVKYKQDPNDNWRVVSFIDKEK